MSRDTLTNAQREACPEQPRLPKDEAACCLSRRDALGRMPIGYCSPDCERRPA